MSVGIEGIRAIPSHKRGTFGSAGAFLHLNAIDPYAIALESKRSGRAFKRLAVRDAVFDGQRAESERTLIRTVQVVLAAEGALHLVVIDVERMFEIRRRP